MPSYKHKRIREKIAQLVSVPSNDHERAQWIKAHPHINLLCHNQAEEIIIYAQSGTSSYTRIHTVLVPESNLRADDTDDLLDWSGSPSSSLASYCWTMDHDEVRIDRSPQSFRTKTLQGCRQLVFGRHSWVATPKLPDRQQSYFEISQEYTHVTKIHLLPERNAYCRIDRLGDLEYVVSLTMADPQTGVSLVTFKRDQLEQYLAASSSCLVQMFEFFLWDRQDSSDSIKLPYTPDEVIRTPDLHYTQCVDGAKAGRTKGFQIISTARPRNKLFAGIKGTWDPNRDRQYVDFIARDGRNRRITKISTDPGATTNCFATEGNSLPFEMSPAFFRPEVLQKYKADTDKYTIADRQIRCRGAWELRSFDVNEAGQVATYIRYLRDLPYKEQLYWKSCNERPKEGISERALRTDFEGEFVEPDDPLLQIKKIMDGWRGGVAWWSPRDAAAALRVVTPRTDSRDEWGREFSNLAKLVIEGFEVKFIREHLNSLEIAWRNNQQSLALIEHALAHLSGDEQARRLDGLREVHTIRSKVDAHSTGKHGWQLALDARRRHDTYTAHFEHVCQKVVGELEQIQQCFGGS